MQDNNQKLLKGICIIGVGTVLTKMISFIMMPFFSTWLSTEEFGIYDHIATYVSLCVPFATLQLDQAVFRVSIQNRDKSKAAYVKTFQIITPLIIGGAFLVFVILRKLEVSTDVAIAFISYFIALSCYNVNAEYLRGNDRLVDYSLHNIIVGILTVVSSIILVKICGYGVSGLLSVFGVSYGISAIAITLRVKPWRIGQSELSRIKVRKLLDYSVPLIPNSISWWITNVSDRTVIRIIQGSYHNGVYAICCKIPTMLSLIFSVFNLSFQQVAMQAGDNQSQRKYYDALLKKVIRILFSGCIVIIGATPPLYYIFLRKDYWSGISCVPVLLLGAIMLSLSQYIGDILLVDKRTKVIGGSTLTGAIANIIMNLILIPRLGIMGASIATMISYFIMFLLRFICVKDRFSISRLLKAFLYYFCLFFIYSYITIKIGENVIYNAIMLIIGIVFFLIVNHEIVSSTWRNVIRK